MASRTAFPGTSSSGITHTSANDNSLPGGWIGYVEITADSATFTSSTPVDITGLSQAVTVNTSRRLRLEFQGYDSFTAGGTAEVVDYYIREGTTILATWRTPQFGATTSQASVYPVGWVTPTSGSHTYKVSAARIGGSTGAHFLQASVVKAWLAIIDEGPA